MRLVTPHVPPATLPILWAVPHLIIQHCPQPGCRFTASALSMGRVDRALAAHIINAHWRREKEQA